MAVETFKPQPHGFFFTDGDGGRGHVSMAGAFLLIKVGRRIRAFEMHRFFGPIPVNLRTKAPLATDPGFPFWDAYERWDKGGRLIDGQMCVVPEWCRRCDGSGHIRVPKTREAKRCPVCHGERIEGKREHVKQSEQWLIDNRTTDVPAGTKLG